jgi:hemolysin activation/secretion protein
MSQALRRLLGGAVLAAAVSAAWAGGQAADGPIRFDISRFDVAGNTFLSQADIDAALKPMTGKNRDFADVQRALEVLEALYHQRGYKLVTVQLPEQELNSGVVRLVVAPAKIGRITVSGNKFHDEANVRRSLPTLVPGQSPNLDRVSANLKQANEQPARRIAMKLQGGEGDEVDARLEVSDEKPWKAMLNLDNTGTDATGKTHASAILQHANLFGRDHLASFQYTTTLEEPSKVNVYGLGYHIPLYELGHALDLYATYSDVDSGTVTTGALNLAVSGKGSVVGARYSQVLARSADADRRLVYGFESKAYKNVVLFAGQNFGYNVTVHPFSVDYQANRTMGNASGAYSVGLVRNIPGGSDGDEAALRQVRTRARGSYTIMRLSASYTQTLASQWLWRLLANGQLSADALVPGEQFGAGGNSSVRGFDERVLAADSGMTVNAELYTPPLGQGPWVTRVLGFVDLAHGKRNKTITGELGSASISSAGLGLRIARGDAVNLQLDCGRVISDDGFAPSGKNKVHVRLGLAY